MKKIKKVAIQIILIIIIILLCIFISVKTERRVFAEENYQVIFNNNNEKTTVIVNNGELVTPIDISNDDKNDDFVFSYWKTSDETTQFDFSTPITKNIELTAVYIRKSGANMQQDVANLVKESKDKKNADELFVKKENLTTKTMLKRLTSTPVLCLVCLVFLSSVIFTIFLGKSGSKNNKSNKFKK